MWYRSGMAEDERARIPKNIRFDADLKERVDARAALDRRSFNAEVNYLVALALAYLDRHPEGQVHTR